MAKKTAVDEIREIAKEVGKSAEPIISDIKSKAEPVVNDIRAKAEPAYEDLKTKAEPVVSDIKTKAEPYISKVKEKTAPAQKAVKKQSEKALKAAKAVSDDLSLKAAKVKCKEEVFIQYSSHELRAADIIDRAKQDFVSKGNKLSDIKEIQVYIKPSDNAAYYVVNHSETGKIGF